MPEPESQTNPSSEKKTSKRKHPTKNVSRSKKTKLSLINEIDLSKQLVKKLRTSKATTNGVPKQRKYNSNEIKYCGNGKPMPSLAELEKMFEDSDDEDEAHVDQKNKISSSTSIPLSPAAEVSQTAPEPSNLTSPKTIKKIASRILDMVSNLTEPPIVLDDDGPPPPVIKPKKHKKTETPYIIGCKDRPYIPSKPNNNVFKGDEDYGVDKKNTDNDEDDITQKRAKRTKGGNFSKSIFNAVADEIAEQLKKRDEDSDANSDDSNKTVAYEYYTALSSKQRIRSFSPLPSTSKDNETFVKNDQLFNESLISENASSSITYIDDDIEIIETPCETVVLNDCDNTLTSNKSTMLKDPSVVELIELASVGTPDNCINLDESYENDNSVQVIDVKPASPIPVEEYYSNINHNANTNDIDVCEVIDVDDVIAENAAIIKKYSSKKDLNTITSVDLSSPRQGERKKNTTIIPIIQYNPNPTIDWESCDARPIRKDVVELCERNLREIQKILNVGSNDRDLLKNTLYSLEYLSQACNDTTNTAAVESPSFPNQFDKEGTNRPTQREGTTGSPRGGKGIGDCPICMDVLSNKAVASTMCGHLFCMSCIKLAIKSNGKKCPTCRKTLKGAGFHQIFL